MKSIINWFLGLVGLLSSQRGDNVNPTIAVEDPPADAGNEDSEGGEEGKAEGKDEDTEDEEEGVDSYDGIPDAEGRAKYIPRKKFDKVNAKAQKVNDLIESGSLVEDEDGELRVNPKLAKPKSKEDDSGNDKITRDSFIFK